MDLQITPAAREDWRAYRDIRLRALLESPEAYASDHATEAEFDRPRWFTRLAGAETYLARSGGDVVATVTGVPGPGETRVVAMYVDPSRRGLGLAHRLLDAVAQSARAREDRRLVLDVSDANPVAERCYRRYGFAETGVRRPMARDASLTEIEFDFPLRAGAEVVSPRS